MRRIGKASRPRRNGKVLKNARRNGKRSGRRPIFDIRHFGTVAGLRGQGKIIREIAKELRVSKSLVHKTLKNISPPALDYHGSED